jgi:hypothetical protein
MRVQGGVSAVQPAAVADAMLVTSRAIGCSAVFGHTAPRIQLQLRCGTMMQSISAQQNKQTNKQKAT